MISGSRLGTNRPLNVKKPDRLDKQYDADDAGGRHAAYGAQRIAHHAEPRKAPVAFDQQVVDEDVHQYIVCGIYTVFVMWSISFWEIRKLESSASTAGPDPFFFEDITRAMKDLCEQAGI